MDRVAEAHRAIIAYDVAALRRIIEKHKTEFTDPLILSQLMNYSLYCKHVECALYFVNDHGVSVDTEFNGWSCLSLLIQFDDTIQVKILVRDDGAILTQPQLDEIVRRTMNAGFTLNQSVFRFLIRHGLRTRMFKQPLSLIMNRGHLRGLETLKDYETSLLHHRVPKCRAACAALIRQTGCVIVSRDIRRMIAKMMWRYRLKKFGFGSKAKHI